jgi:C1A family cysteine protease
MNVATIDSHPTNTNLRNQKDDYVELLKSSEIMDLNIKVPDNFDGRKVWGDLLATPENQGTCGSCWAFASVGALGDRFNIQSMGLMKIQLSAAKLILCDVVTTVRHPENNPDAVSRQQSRSNKTSACFGNTLADAWRYLFIRGTNTEECVPYNKRCLYVVK